MSVPATVIVWFRRDLRVDDHPALVEATTAGHVVPLFVVDPALWDAPRTAPARRWFLAGSNTALDAALRERGSRLVVRHGRPEDVVPAVAAEVGAGAVLATRDVTPGARRRDRAVAAALEADGRSLRLRRGLLLAEPEALAGRSGGGHTVFTPFWRAPPRTAERCWPPPTGCRRSPTASRATPSRRSRAQTWRTCREPGEAAARARLDAWLRPAWRPTRTAATSSPARPRPAWAPICTGLWSSPLEVEARCAGAGSPEAFRRQLGWRGLRPPPPVVAAGAHPRTVPASLRDRLPCRVG